MLGINYLNREPLKNAIISAFIINLLAHLFQGWIYRVISAPLTSAQHHHQLVTEFHEHSFNIDTKNVANAFLGLRRSSLYFLIWTDPYLIKKKISDLWGFFWACRYSQDTKLRPETHGLGSGCWSRKATQVFSQVFKRSIDRIFCPLAVFAYRRVSICGVTQSELLLPTTTYFCSKGQICYLSGCSSTAE